MAAATCKTCPFWFPDEDDPTIGDCRIRAPKHETLNGGDTRAFPATVEEDWCGEHPDFDHPRHLPAAP